MDASTLVNAAIVLSIVLIVTALGMRAPPGAAACVLRDPSRLARSVIAMNVLHPLVVASFVVVSDLRAPVKIALVALAISPVPPFLPRRQLQLVSDPRYVIGLLVASSVISVASVPITVFALAKFVAAGATVSARNIAATVAATVLLPLAAGLLLRRLCPRFSARADAIVNRAGGALLLAALCAIGILHWRAMAALIGDGTLAAIVGSACAGLAVGHWLAGPRADERTVLALSTASRHPGVALIVANTAFPSEPAAASAVLLALLTSVIVVAPYAAWRGRRHAAHIRAGRPLDS